MLRKIARYLREPAPATGLRPALQELPAGTIQLDYPVTPRVRWPVDAPNKSLDQLLESQTGIYEKNLASFLAFEENFARFDAVAVPNGTRPGWINGWLPGLDTLSLYGFLARMKPGTYMEIGSGNSTKVARQAINDHQLATKIFSVDPQPRAEIDGICDHVFWQPLEDCDPSIFMKLQAGDVLFFDGSHRTLQNSDVTTFFLDILPQLPRGVLIGIHDIFLPYDYPAEWLDRYYSEQYMLAAWLLGDAGRSVRIELPCFYAAHTGISNRVLQSVWSALDPKVERFGGAFWFTVCP